MQTKKWLNVVNVVLTMAILLVTTLLVTSCSGSTPAVTNKATFIFTQEFDTLNPLYTNMSFSQITQQLWSCWAWDFNDKNEPQPVLVKEMPSSQNGGISADGKVITLKLRNDIVWSDGQPITADDFIFTYQMTIDPNNAVATAYPYNLMESVTAPDSKTVVVTFKDPFAAWLGSLWKGLLPKHIVQPQYAKDNSLNNVDYNRNPTVGCGPYIFSKWESGSYAQFITNKNYWGTKPKIDQITIQFVPDDAAQIAALKAGNGELGTFFAYSDIPDLQKAGIQVLQVNSGYDEGIYFYLDPQKGHPALQDVRVRQAIVMAIDRNSITKNLLLDLTKPAATDWDNTPYVDPSIQPYPFDVEQAKKLLDEAGWTVGAEGIREKDGVKLELKYGTVTREVRQDTQAIVQQDLLSVGIKIDLYNYDEDTFFSGYDKQGPAATGELDMYEFSQVSTAFPDPDNPEWLCSEIPTADYPAGINWSAFCDKTLDQLFQLEVTQTDYATRQQTFYQITKYIFDQAYWIGLWQDPDQWGISSRLTGVKISGVTPFYNIADWQVKD